MGCDIHAYVDYDQPNSEYVGQLGSFNIGRDYLLFSIMASVRLPRGRSNDIAVFEPKGLPEHLSWKTLDEATLFIADPHDSNERGMCSKESAEQYHQSWLRHKQGVGGYVGGIHGDTQIDPTEPPTRVYHPDWHSHSWLTTNELKQVIEKYASYSELEQKIAERVNGEWVIPEGYKPDPAFTHFFENKDENYQFMPIISVEPIALKVPPAILAVYCAMKSLEESGCTPRFVFWFDN